MVSCNDAAGNIEMTAAIRNPAGRIPEGFVVVSNPKEIQRTYTFGELEQEFLSDEQNMQWMTLSVTAGFTSCEKISVDGIEICKDMRREYTFVCRYALEEQGVSLTGSFDVSGSDYQNTIEGEPGQGKLSYTLEEWFNYSKFYLASVF